MTQENLTNEEILRQDRIRNTIAAKVAAHQALTDSDIKG